MNLKKLIAGALTAGLLLTASGCSGNSTPTEKPSGSETSGGYQSTFTFNVGGEPSYLDPARNGDSINAEITFQIWYPLFTVVEDGSTQNADCVDLSISDDGLVYTLKLDENAKWSDGQPLTAQQYEYSIKRAIGMGYSDVGYQEMISDYVVGARAHAEALDDVADMDDVGVKALDDYTLEITLIRPVPFFELLLSNGVYTAVREDFAPEHSSDWSLVAGFPTSGPYTVTKLDAGSEVIMEKNDNFVHADKVVTQTLVAKIIEDLDASPVAFQTKEIDYATSINSDVVKLYEGKPELLITQSIVNYYMSINSYGDNEALKDGRVRRAIQLGIDRQKIVEGLDCGEAYYELNGFVPIGLPGDHGDFRTEADAEEKLVYTDKEQAKALLAEAGYDESNPLTIEYYYNQNTMHDLVAAVIRTELAEIGINVVLKTGEIRTFFTDKNDGKYETARSAFSADYLDPYSYIQLANNENAKVVTQGDDTLNALIAETMDLTGSERMAKLHEAEHYYVADQAYVNPLFGYRLVYLAKAGTTGIVHNPQGSHYFWYVAVPE